MADYFHSIFSQQELQGRELPDIFLAYYDLPGKSVCPRCIRRQTKDLSDLEGGMLIFRAKGEADAKGPLFQNRCLRRIRAAT